MNELASSISRSMFLEQPSLSSSVIIGTVVTRIIMLYITLWLMQIMYYINFNANYVRLHFVYIMLEFSEKWSLNFDSYGLNRAQ